jgi:1-acyl-sn-glycerol-3-phosphate acyltransferase
MILLRSALFAAAMLLVTPPYALLSLFTFPFPPMARYRFISGWARIMLVLLRVICGISFRVEGRENIPATPSMILSKHQSAWETLALQVLLPPQVWVLKRELLRIPFFGWGLAMMNPIAIDRSAGRKALKQMLEQGRDRLARGFWIVMFPEGTRIAPGQRGQYFVGGAWLATQTGAPVVPVAHNAGTVWPKGAFLKRPGTIVVSFGPVIDPAGRKAEELNRQVEAWIEAEVERLGSARC